MSKKAWVPSRGWKHYALWLEKRHRRDLNARAMYIRGLLKEIKAADRCIQGLLKANGYPNLWDECMNRTGQEPQKVAKDGSLKP